MTPIIFHILALIRKQSRILSILYITYFHVYLEIDSYKLLFCSRLSLDQINSSRINERAIFSSPPLCGSVVSQEYGINCSYSIRAILPRSHLLPVPNFPNPSPFFFNSLLRSLQSTDLSIPLLLHVVMALTAEDKKLYKKKKNHRTVYS